MYLPAQVLFEHAFSDHDPIVVATPRDMGDKTEAKRKLLLNSLTDGQ